MGRLVVFAVLATLLFTGAATPATPGESFFFGFSEDLPKEIGNGATAPAADLGGSAFRLTTLWSPGQAALAAEEAVKLDRATAAAGGQRIVLAVFADAGTKAPQDATGRETYCSYVRTLLTRYPSIRDVVIWNEPNKSLFWSPQLAADGTPVAAARYEDLLARCYDVLHGTFSNVNVIGLALSSTGNDNAGSASPGAFIRSVGDAYRASGRAGPLLDTVGYHPYGADAAERPWRKHIGSKTIAQGDWNKLMYNLFLAFDGTAQPIPGEAGVRIWYTESASQTAIDPEKASYYTGTENVRTVSDYAGGEPDAPAPAETTSAPDQWTQALDAIRLAACQPQVAAYFNFLLADEPRLAGWQSGPYWADLTRKDSWPAFRQAAAEATAGTVACDSLKGGRPSPDFMPPNVPTAVEALAAADGTSVQLSWMAATDASTLTYRVYRDGAHVATTSATSWTQTAATPKQTYTYMVRALDAAGNLGDASASVTVTTPEPPAAAPDPTTAPAPLPAGGGTALPPDLSVALATTPTPPETGAPVDVTLTVANEASAGTGTGVVVQVDLPAGATLLGPPAYERGSGCSGSSPLVCSLDFLPNGMATRIRFSFTAPAGGMLVVAVSAVEQEPDTSDNRAAIEVLAPRFVIPAADVAPPAAPSRLRARATRRTLTLTWSRSADHAHVRSYLVFRDGVLRRSARSLTFSERARSGRHVYTVRALDRNGLRSPPARIVVRR